jgi:lipopolysaccharide/colanic/teichoic acid biosynthesis glycosyltransferase
MLATTRRQPTQSQQRRPSEGAPALPPLAPPETRYVWAKDLFERAAAIVILTLAAPVILVLAALVKLTSRGPAFYSQTRLGLNGRPYEIFKLRTMCTDAERMSGPLWSGPGDPRVTGLGRFLRRSHLDELPQLWNVVKGDMNLVGPRPERPEFVAPLKKAVPYYADRLQIRPGVTGLAQIQLPADTDLESVRSKVAYDLFYLRHVSLWLDIRIFFLTAFYAAGTKIRWPFRLLGMPHAEAIEREYRDRCAHRPPAPPADRAPPPAAAEDTLPEIHVAGAAVGGSRSTTDTLPEIDLGRQRSSASPLPASADSSVRIAFGV